MAFGFTPKFEQSLKLNGLNPQHYLVIALTAAERLGWNTTGVTNAGFIAYTGFSMRSWNEEVNVIIEGDVVNLKSRCLGNQLVDWGKNKENIVNFINEFETIQASLNEEQLNDKLAELESQLNSAGTNLQTESPGTSLGNTKGFLGLFVPKKGYFITPIIININLLVFVLMVISGISVIEPTTTELIAWGANIRSITLGGQWWRLITNVFLHIGILHILLNMYALLYIGLLLEPYLGKLRFAAAYLFTGILASVASIYWHPFTVSAGASGAIFGMYGVFLAMLTTNFIDKKTRGPLLASIGVFVVFNLMNGVKAGIDNAAHIGGLASGLIIGYAYYPSLKKPDALNLKYVTISLLLLATLTTSFVMYHKIPNDIAKYDAKMQDFIKNEAAALKIYDMKNSPDTAILSVLKKEGLVNWNANLKILDEADKLDIPAELIYKDALLRRYCKSRIVSYNLIYKAVDEKTNRYRPSIDSCTKQIQSIVDSLKKE